MPSLQHVSVFFEINPFEMASQNISKEKKTSYAFCSFCCLHLPLTFSSFWYLLVVSRKTLTKVYFCNVFLHLFQNELLGNNHGDTAKGKSAAQLGHMIGVESEQIPSCVGVLSLGLFSPVDKLQHSLYQMSEDYFPPWETVGECCF